MEQKINMKSALTECIFQYENMEAKIVELEEKYKKSLETIEEIKKENEFLTNEIKLQKESKEKLKEELKKENVNNDKFKNDLVNFISQYRQTEPSLINDAIEENKAYIPLTPEIIKNVKNQIKIDVENIEEIYVPIKKQSKKKSSNKPSKKSLVVQIPKKKTMEEKMHEILPFEGTTFFYDNELDKKNIQIYEMNQDENDRILDVEKISKKEYKIMLGKNAYEILPEQAKGTMDRFISFAYLNNNSLQYYNDGYLINSENSQDKIDQKLPKEEETLLKPLGVIDFSP